MGLDVALDDRQTAGHPPRLANAKSHLGEQDGDPDGRHHPGPAVAPSVVGAVGPEHRGGHFGGQYADSNRA
eukprot:1323422-Alexandrium_andersonii.AAC.1